MHDPLSRALNEAPPAHEPHTYERLSRHRVAHAPPLGVVLDALRRQLGDALSIPFFDEPLRIEVIPVTKRALTEAGAATVVARKRHPAYQATVTVEIRCDHEEPETDPADTGRYQVRATAQLRCEDARGFTEREVAVTVREIDRALLVDAAQLRSDMAAAIRSIGKPP